MFQLFAKAEDSSPIVRPKKPLTFLNPNKDHSPKVLVDLSREPALTRQRILKFANETFNEHSPLVISPYLAKTLKHRLLRPKFEKCVTRELDSSDSCYSGNVDECSNRSMSNYDDVQIIDTKLAAKSKISTRKEKEAVSITCARTRPFVGKPQTIPKIQTFDSSSRLTQGSQFLADIHRAVAEEKCINRLLQDMIIKVDNECLEELRRASTLTLTPGHPVKYIKELKELHIKQFVTNISKCLVFVYRKPSRPYEIRDNDAKIHRILIKLTNFLSRIDPSIRLPDFLSSSLYDVYKAVCLKIGKNVSWPNIPLTKYVMDMFYDLPEVFALISQTKVTEVPNKADVIRIRNKAARAIRNKVLETSTPTESSLQDDLDLSLLPEGSWTICEPSKPTFRERFQDDFDDVVVVDGTHMIADSYSERGIHSNDDTHSVLMDEDLPYEEPITDPFLGVTDAQTIPKDVFFSGNSAHDVKTQSNGFGYSIVANLFPSDMRIQKSYPSEWKSSADSFDFSTKHDFRFSEVSVDNMVNPMSFTLDPSYDCELSSSIKFADNTLYSRQHQQQQQHYPVDYTYRGSQYL